MAEISVVRTSTRRRPQRFRVHRDAWWALFFLAPSFLGFLVFYWLPILAGLTLSLFRWDLLSAPEWAGSANFRELVTDAGLHQALINTFYFTVVTVPVGMVLALLVALALNQKLHGLSIYRVAYFMPVVASVVASALVWQWMFLPRYGLINNILRSFNSPEPMWLSSPRWAMPAIIIYSIWKSLGYNMILFLAGLQAIPGDLYEAASVDGANRWQQFRHLTLPLLSPTTVMILILAMIGSFQVFDPILVMTGQANPGGPRGSAVTMVFYIYTNAFKFSRMGYASTVALVLFTIIFVVTLIQLRLQRRWVHYG
ncbi:MAG: sugar ABC transporter permease [Herpetosiphon sp.]